MKILIPLAGSTAFADPDQAGEGYGQILPLIEVFNRTVIEYVIGNLPSRDSDHFVFVVRKEDCDKHCLDAILELLRPGCSIVRAEGATGGQLCSCLLGIEHIDGDESLLIANGNQFLFDDVEKIVAGFETGGADGGIVTFPNIHPRWSYVRVARDGETVLETSEKRPISRHACVGLFFYRHGRDFVESAKTVIRKGTRVDGTFYVSSTFNEMILRGKRIVTHEVEGDAFRSLHTPRGVEAFIQTLQERVS